MYLSLYLTMLSQIFSSIYALCVMLTKHHAKHRAPFSLSFISFGAYVLIMHYMVEFMESAGINEFWNLIVHDHFHVSFDHFSSVFKIMHNHKLCLSLYSDQ